MIGGGRHFCFRCFQKLLIALVDQLGNFAPNQVPGISEDLYMIVAVLLDGSRHIVFFHEHPVLRAGGLDQVKAMIPQPGNSVFVSSFFNLGGHGLLLRPLIVRGIRCNFFNNSSPLETCWESGRPLL